MLVLSQDRGEVVAPHIDESITPRKKAPRTFSTGIRAGIMNEYGQVGEGLSGLKARQCQWVRVGCQLELPRMMGHLNP